MSQIFLDFYYIRRPRRIPLYGILGLAWRDVLGRETKSTRPIRPKSNAPLMPRLSNAKRQENMRNINPRVDKGKRLKHPSDQNVGSFGGQGS